MSETEDVSTGEVMASEDMDQDESKINSAKDSMKAGADSSAEKISELKEKVILNGDNGNSMDSISNGHENENDIKSASNGDGEGTSNGGEDCEEASNGGDGEVTIEDGEVSTRDNTDIDGEVSNGASSTPVVSEPTSPQRHKRKEPQVVRIDEGEDDTEDIITEDTDDDLDGEEEEEEVNIRIRFHVTKNLLSTFFVICLFTFLSYLILCILIDISISRKKVILFKIIARTYQ